VPTSRAFRIIVGMLASLLAFGVVGGAVAAAGEADLSVFMQGSGVPERDYNAYNGEIVYYSVSVSNHSDVPATGVSTTQILPDELTFVADGTDPRCSANGQVVTCDFGTVGPLEQFYYLVYTRANATGTVASTVRVSASEPDPLPGNNSSTATTTVQPAAHLSIAVAESADPAKSGSRLTYTVTVTNNGPDAAHSYGYTDIYWEAAVRKNTLDGWSASANVTCTQTFYNHLGCDMGTLDPGESFTVTVTIRPLGDGSIEFWVSPRTVEWPGGDTVTETTTVRQSRS
jgi:uncharacterized repeat protein (TIGR01451 family)